MDLFTPGPERSVEIRDHQVDPRHAREHAAGGSPPDNATLGPRGWGLSAGSVPVPCADDEGMVTSTFVEPTALEETVQRYAALADPTRLRVLAVLAGAACCVCEVHAAVDVAPNLLSYHLRVLREAGLIDGTRRGRWIDYRVADGADEFVADALAAAGLAACASAASADRCSVVGGDRR